MGYYEEFENLCFVDTLDNTDAISFTGQQHSLFGLTSENSERIKRQNSKKISVIIGNPPYNANQANENDNNKNREYPTIDKRIKDTYIKYSTAQKTKVYDMYARFYRWASDRLDKNGVLSFITNRSFIDSRTFDGFRKTIQDEFSECYIVDTKSDVRANPEIAGTTHNVFGIQTGVAIMFLVKKEGREGKCNIHYVAMEDDWRKEIKLDWLRNNKLETISFVKINPDRDSNWINLTNNDFSSLLTLASKQTKLTNKKKEETALFKLFSLGVVTNRDEWAYDNKIECLEKKIKFFYNVYKKEQSRWNKTSGEQNISNFVSREIKWTSELEDHLQRGTILEFNKNKIRQTFYRPFVKKYQYHDRAFTHRLYQQEFIFPIGKKDNNMMICFSGIASSKRFNILAANSLVDLHFNGDTNCLPLYSIDKNGTRIDNITDWGMEQFHNNYKDKKITKEDVFYYTYAVLHNPVYCKTYELNLNREFPRLPFYDDFWKWVRWGKKLMELHINYETVKQYPLKEHTIKTKDETTRQKEIFPLAAEPSVLYALQPKNKVKLKADKERGIIEIDELTSLSGIPKEAWDYKLGNRSALEWILDQYKEKKPSDPTIAEKFNTYRFADYKTHVIDLLKRVCTVSVETMKIISVMK